MPESADTTATRFLKTPDAALRLGLSPRTLEKHRCYGTGPVFRKLGGRIVYATCSLEQAEGEDQIARFLDARPDFARDPIATSELPEGMAPDPQGWLRTLPDTLASAGGTDGFFIARLVRRAH